VHDTITTSTRAARRGDNVDTTAPSPSRGSHPPSRIYRKKKRRNSKGQVRDFRVLGPFLPGRPVLPFREPPPLSVWRKKAMMRCSEQADVTASIRKYTPPCFTSPRPSPRRGTQRRPSQLAAERPPLPFSLALAGLLRRRATASPPGPPSLLLRLLRPLSLRRLLRL